MMVASSSNCCCCVFFFCYCSLNVIVIFVIAVLGVVVDTHTAMVQVSL